MAEKILKKKSLFSFHTIKAGILLSIFAQPFEVLRTSSIQNNLKQTDINFKGLKQLFWHIKQTEGLRGFFRGSLLAICKNSATFFLFFTGLENFTKRSFQSLKIKDENQIETVDVKQILVINTLNFSNACLSKLISTLFVSPFNVLKTRFEIVGNNEYTSISHAFSSTYQKEGIKGFYRGILPTLLRDVPMSGIQYSVYRSMINSYQYFSEKKAIDNQIIIFISGSISNVFALMCVYPFDNIRVRFQLNQNQNFKLKNCIQDIYKDEGIKGFYKGYLPRLLKKAASGALVWGVYENFKHQEQNQFETKI